MAEREVFVKAYSGWRRLLRVLWKVFLANWRQTNVLRALWLTLRGRVVVLVGPVEQAPLRARPPQPPPHGNCRCVLIPVGARSPQPPFPVLLASREMRLRETAETLRGSVEGMRMATEMRVTVQALVALAAARVRGRIGQEAYEETRDALRWRVLRLCHPRLLVREEWLAAVRCAMVEGDRQQAWPAGSTREVWRRRGG